MTNNQLKQYIKEIQKESIYFALFIYCNLITIYTCVTYDSILLIMLCSLVTCLSGYGYYLTYKNNQLEIDLLKIKKNI